MDAPKLEKLLLDKLTDGQKDAVKAKDRRLLVVAGAARGRPRSWRVALRGGWV